MKTGYSTFNIIFLLIALTLSGCSFFSSQPKVKPKETKKSPFQILVAQNKELTEKNKQLFDRVEVLEKQQTEDREKFKKRIKNLDRTIYLLEQNLKQIKTTSLKKAKHTAVVSSAAIKKEDKKESPLKPGKKVPQTVQKAEIDVAGTGLFKEFKTPENSEAIKTVSLIPSSNSSSKEQKKTITLPITDSDHNETKTVIKDSKKVEELVIKNDNWEDPDLKSPVSPIPLQVIPGAKRLYQKAFKVYSNGELSEAINLFEGFLLKFPNDKDADNSQYWIGQAYFKMDNYLKAEHAFRKVIKNYKHEETKRGYKTPDAMLMLGRVYLTRNKPIKARYYFQQVIERFSETRSAAKAKREIQSLDSF